MSSSPSPAAPGGATPSDLTRLFWKPFLYRGIVAAVVALLGVGWIVQPGPTFVAIVLGLWLLLTGVLIWPVTRLGGLPAGLRTGLTSAALAWVVAGAILLFQREPEALAFIAAFGLGVGGASELVAGLQARALGRGARDLVISGGVGVIGAVILAIAHDTDAHGVMGIAGMIAAVFAVLHIIGGLGYRHDAKAEAQEN